jgi:VWFA-related protein
MKPVRGWTKFTFALLCCGACGLTQEPTFKTQAPLVLVPVTVSTKTGERIWGLQDGDFQLLDNGQERKATVEPWGTYQSHVSLVIVIQTSSLSHSAILKVKKIAGMLDSITGEGGEVAVVTADDDVQTPLDFTTRWESIQETFEKLKARDACAGRVLDGVEAAIAMLSQKPQGQRRLILVLSEARDRGSKAKASDVLTHAQQQSVTIYTATYSAYVTPFTTKGADYQAGPIGGGDLFQVFIEIARATKQNMGKALAEYTGGRQLGFNTLHHLEEDLAEIGKEVHSQYQLSFVPSTEQTPVYHEITVKVKGNPDALIRARPGYWSASPAIR